MLDVLLIVDVSVILFIAVTGGGRYSLAHITVRATSVANFVLIGILLVVARYSAWAWRPKFGWAQSEV